MSQPIQNASGVTGATNQNPGNPMTEPWPELPWDAWKDTCDTLHLWTQVVGKVKLELTPFLNEWWEVGFDVTARGLTASAIPYDCGIFSVGFDFVDHHLSVATSEGAVRMMPLAPRPVAEFYRTFMATLGELGIDVSINPLPVEVPDPVPFDRDHAHAAYDPDYVNRWWRILVGTTKVLQRYRSTFVGKSSPVLFYWGSFDLNATRFSGRPATPPQGPRFFQLAEDQENASCGFWPGNPNAAGVTLGQPAFYAYTYPAPQGFADAPVRPASAYYDPKLGEFILPYERLRAGSPDPASIAQAILHFLQSTYEAGATLGRWDRAFLERAPAQPDPAPAPPPGRRDEPPGRGGGPGAAAG